MSNSVNSSMLRPGNTGSRGRSQGSGQSRDENEMEEEEPSSRRRWGQSGDNRDRSRSRSSGGGSTSRYMTADRSGTQATITNWTTPGKKQEQEFRKELEKELNADEDEDVDSTDGSEESSSSSSKVEVVGTRITTKKGGTSEDGKSDEDNASMSDYKDANEEELPVKSNQMEVKESIEEALGLTAGGGTSPSEGGKDDDREKNPISTPRAATFSDDTNFLQKKTPGSYVRRTKQSTLTNPYAKAKVTATTTSTRMRSEREHENYTYIRVQINLKGEHDPPTAIQKILGDLLSVLQQKDPNACFTKELDVRRQIYELADFPDDFREFYDDWSFWEHDVSYFLNPAPLGGNGRTYHGTVCVASDWTGERLMEQCVFAIRSIKSKGNTLRASLKELQSLRTSRNIILLGVPSNVDFEAVNNLLKEVLAVGLDNMLAADPMRYPEDIYQATPEFSVVRMYIKNTPFEQRDKNDTIPSWARMPLHLEVDLAFEDELWEIVKFSAESNLLNSVFGDYSFVLKNSPPNEASEGLKQRMKTALRTHMAIVLSMGRVFLRGLENPDEVMDLRRHDEEDGTPKKPVQMSVRRLMMFYKVNGIKLWQFVCPCSDGGWCAYYASGKVCDAHRILAESWSGAAAAHVRFKGVSRGIVRQDISKLLRKSFSLAACREAERARYVNGAIVSEQDASMSEIGQKLKHCKWVDSGTLLGKPAAKQSEQHAKAILDDDSLAFTFKAQESVGGETVAHSLFNPETGKAWEEGEKERHLQGALAAGMEQTFDDASSIASDESALWKKVEVEFEGMEEVDNSTEMENEERVEMEMDVGNSENKDLSKELRDILLASGRIGSDEGQPLGQDMNQLMKAAIAALKSKASPTAPSGSRKLDESNTGKDRHATDDGAAGGQGP